MFRLSFKRKKAPPKTQLPLELEPSEVAALQELLAHPHFSVFEDALSRLAEFHARAVVYDTDLDLAKTAYRRGLVRGLQDAAELCAVIVTKTKEYEENANRRAQRSESSTDADRSAFWGNTLFWGTDSQRVSRS